MGENSDPDHEQRTLAGMPVARGGSPSPRLPAIGPMENMDIVGLSLVESVQRYLLPDLATNALPSTELTSRLSRDETGMRSGRGFYDW